MDIGGPWKVALVDDRERVQPCDREVALGEHAVSAHVLSRTGPDKVRHALRILASGGPSKVHERSLILDGDRAVVAVGAWLCAVDLASLNLLWSTEVDWATCFGVHGVEDDYLSHGELSITRVAHDGEILWQVSGRDLFTGDLRLDRYAVIVADFHQNRYRIDLSTGRIEELQ